MCVIHSWVPFYYTYISFAQSLLKICAYIWEKSKPFLTDRRAYLVWLFLLLLFVSYLYIYLFIYIIIIEKKETIEIKIRKSTRKTKAN